MTQLTLNYDIVCLQAEARQAVVLVLSVLLS